MPFLTAPALLIGLGARILLDNFTRSEEASIRDFVLIGVWQGVGLHYAFKNSGLAILVAFGISTKLFIEYSLVHDTTRSAITLLGVALGGLCTECLSQFFGEATESDRRREKAKKVPSPPANARISRGPRLVQFRNSAAEGDGRQTARQRAFRQTVSDITSVDSNSELIGPKSSMTPLAREIAALRTRASLADSERRRYKEERKWAISQGNQARAAQMKWQVKRYTALMESFHREADAKVIEASSGRLHQHDVEEEPRASALTSRHSRHRRDEQTNGQSGRSTDTANHFKRQRISKTVARDAVR